MKNAMNLEMNNRFYKHRFKLTEKLKISVFINILHLEIPCKEKRSKKRIYQHEIMLTWL